MTLYSDRELEKMSNSVDNRRFAMNFAAVGNPSSFEIAVPWDLAVLVEEIVMGRLCVAADLSLQAALRYSIDRPQAVTMNLAG